MCGINIIQRSELKTHGPAPSSTARRALSPSCIDIRNRLWRRSLAHSLVINRTDNKSDYNTAAARTMLATEETGRGGKVCGGCGPDGRRVDISCGQSLDTSGQLPAAPRCQMRSILSASAPGLAGRRSPASQSVVVVATQSRWDPVVRLLSVTRCWKCSSSSDVNYRCVHPGGCIVINGGW